jgi:Flp pilus assembly protein TadB
MATLDPREPPHGDFVAYVEQIEREQLARALQPHRLAHPAADGKVASPPAPQGGARALSAKEAQRVLQQLKAQAGPARPLGATIGVVVGAGLVAFGLLAEGGMVLVLLGAALLWHNLRKLERARRTAQPSPAQQVDDVFSSRPQARGRGT